MSIETMTKISSTTVGAGGSSTITFTGIPQDYTDLRITLSARGTENNYYTNFLMTFNGGGTSDYTFIRGIGISNGLSGDGPFTSQSSIYIGEANAATSVASSFCHFDIHIGNYTEPRFKGVSIDKSQTNSTSTPYILGITGAGWLNTAPITSITLSNTSGLFAQYSTATLYGIKNQTKLAGNSVKATGGNISFDGTYVYHTFNGTDNFVPTTPLVIDYLVVAGGGGGANSVGYLECSGGGGAGGYRTTVGTSGGGSSAESKLSLTPLTPYLVTIGAGGAGKSTYGNGNQGSNSAFHTIISLGGGAAGADGGGSAGGSGGGAGTSGGVDRVGGLGTANQGYAGGRSKAYASPDNRNAGGGGGGAGGAGVVGEWAIAGDGGPGLTAFDGKTYAGGGGGNTYGPLFYQGLGGSNIGGNGISTQTSGNGGSGRVNTGSGGGASGASGSVSGAGGSGIVLIRYKG